MKRFNFFKKFGLILLSMFSVSSYAENFGNYIINYDNVSDSTSVNWVGHTSWNANKLNFLPNGSPPPHAFHLIASNTTTPLPTWKKHIAEFDFNSSNFFSPNNAGHFGVFLRGDLYTYNSVVPGYPYRGHGVTLGDTSGYGSHWLAGNGGAGACTATPVANGNKHTVAIEVAGINTNSTLQNLDWNCLFGQQTGSNSYDGGDLISLVNNNNYHIKIVSELNEYTQYYTTSYVIVNTSIYTFNGYNFSHPTHSSTVTYSYPFLYNSANPANPAHLGNFFFAASLSTASWVVNINNLKVWTE